MKSAIDIASEIATRYRLGIVTTELLEHDIAKAIEAERAFPSADQIEKASREIGLDPSKIKYESTNIEIELHTNKVRSNKAVTTDLRLIKSIKVTLINPTDFEPTGGV